MTSYINKLLRNASYLPLILAANPELNRIWVK